MSEFDIILLSLAVASMGTCIACFLSARGFAVNNAKLRDEVDKLTRQLDERAVDSQAKDGLVEVTLPLECVGTVRCDFDGIYHAQVFGEEVETDEATYRRVVKARDAYLRHER